MFYYPICISLYIVLLILLIQICNVSKYKISSYLLFLFRHSIIKFLFFFFAIFYESNGLHKHTLDLSSMSMVTILHLNIVVLIVWSSKIFWQFLLHFSSFPLSDLSIWFMPFLPHGPWVTPYTNLNVHGNILSLHIFVLVSMLLPINSHPFFTFFAWKMEFLFFFKFLHNLVTPMSDPSAPSSKCMATPTH